MKLDTSFINLFKHDYVVGRCYRYKATIPDIYDDLPLINIPNTFKIYSNDDINKWFKNIHKKLITINNIDPIIRFEKNTDIAYCDIEECDNNSNNTPGIWITNPEYDTHYCPHCIPDDINENELPILTDENCQLYNPPFAIHYVVKDNNYGSILDWIPLFEDQKRSILFYNMNPKSIYYHKVSVFVRKNISYIYIIDGSLDDIIKELVANNNEYEHINTPKKKVNDSPIWKLIVKKGL